MRPGGRLSSGLARSRASAALLTVSAVVSGLAVFATGSSRAVAHLLDGGAWLSNSSVGSVSHVGPGGLDATVHLHPRAGAAIRVVQDGANVYVVDGLGHLSRIDQAQLSVGRSATLASAGVQVVAGGGMLYSVDGITGAVQSLDPTTLAPLGPPVQLTPPLGAAVVDASGVAWVAMPRQGQVAEIDGSTVAARRHVAPAGDPLELSVVDDVVVSVDPVTAAVSQLTGPRSGTTQKVPLSPSTALTTPAAVQGTPVLPVLDSHTHQLGALNLGGGDELQVDLGKVADQLGPPQVLGGYIYTPDYTTGQLLVVDIATGTEGAPLEVTGHPGHFDLVVQDGMLFVNDTGDNQAWIVSGSGGLEPVSKYDPKAPGDSTPATVTIPPAPPLPPPADTTTTTMPPAGSGQDQATTTTTPVPTTSGDGGHHGHPTNGGDGTPGGGSKGGGGVPVVIPDPGLPGSNPNGAPNDVLASAADGTASVTWAAPTNWHRVTGYTVVVTPGGESRSLPAGTLSFTASGLTNGTAYTFTVTAQSREGSGVAVTSNAVIPGTSALPPVGVSATAGDTVGDVSWQAPAGPGPTGYKISAVPQSAGQTIVTTVGAGVTSAHLVGLSDGTTYVFTVSSEYGQTLSAPTSSSPVTPAGLPGAPVAVSAAPDGNGAVSVVWGAPSDNGSPLTGYTVSWPGGSMTTAATATSAVVTGLVNGQAYGFSVTAANHVGTGPSASASPVTPQSDVPSAPTSLTATPGDGVVTLQWQAPSGNGTAVSHYEVVDVTDATTATVYLPAYTAQNLTNGVSYQFRVYAVGTNGVGGPTATTGSVVPSGPPGAPVGAAATLQGTQALVSWSAGSANGTTISGYKVTASDGTAQTVPSSATSAVFNEAPGATVSFQIVAEGANGLNSAAAATAQVTVPNPPAAPVIVTLTVGRVNAALTWTPVAGVTYAVDPGDGSTATLTSGRATWPNPNDGGVYTVTLTATNSFGSATTTRSWTAVDLTCTGCGCLLSASTGPPAPLLDSFVVSSPAPSGPVLDALVVPESPLPVPACVAP